MAIEIKELYIRAFVDNSGGETGQGSGTGNNGQDKDRIIAECVEQVLAALKDMQER